MEMRIAFNVTGKQTLDMPLVYGGVDLKTIDVVGSELKKLVLKLIHHDSHKDPKPVIKVVEGDIVLPETKGDMNMVLSYKTLQTGRATDKDWSITWPKADEKTVILVENALLKALVSINELQTEGKI